jgi:hypothetical protein
LKTEISNHFNVGKFPIEKSRPHGGFGLQESTFIDIVANFFHVEGVTSEESTRESLKELNALIDIIKRLPSCKNAAGSNLLTEVEKNEANNFKSKIETHKSTLEDALKSRTTTGTGAEGDDPLKESSEKAPVPDSSGKAPVPDSSGKDSEAGSGGQDSEAGSGGKDSAAGSGGKAHKGVVATTRRTKHHHMVNLANKLVLNALIQDPVFFGLVVSQHLEIPSDITIECDRSFVLIRSFFKHSGKPGFTTSGKDIDVFKSTLDLSSNTTSYETNTTIAKIFVENNKVAPWVSERSRGTDISLREIFHR